jgi:hypothetical protein
LFGENEQILPVRFVIVFLAKAEGDQKKGATEAVREHAMRGSGEAVTGAAEAVKED